MLGRGGQLTWKEGLSWAPTTRILPFLFPMGTEADGTTTGKKHIVSGEKRGYSTRIMPGINGRGMMFGTPHISLALVVTLG